MMMSYGAPVFRINRVVSIVLLTYMYFITKTCLYNFDPLKPHFYIIKLGFIGVYIICLNLLKDIDCGTH